jgi:hypothetical protein
MCFCSIAMQDAAKTELPPMAAIRARQADRTVGLS